MAKSRAQTSAQTRRAQQAKKDTKKKLSAAKWLELAAALVLLIGITISLYEWRANRAANQKAAQLVSEANQNINHSVPSTTKPTKSEFDSYTVSPTLPRYIFIPKLGVKAIVRTLGLTTSGQLLAPDNVNDAGWFTGSARPGQPGAVVVDGHVSSWTAKGVFFGLASLHAGDTIQIQRGDNTKISYTVVKSQTYSNTQVDMNAVLRSVNPNKPGLNLITCTGEVIKGTNEFSKRIVVFAQQI